MDKKQCSSCGETKCSCKNKEFTKRVIEIDNPEQITLMRKVVIPASMGDDTTVPPAVGKYKNVLLFYEANSKSYLYSSDGIPTQLVNGFTNYEEAINLPEINGVTLMGNKSSADLKLADAPLVITVADGDTSWSGADTAEDVYNFFLNKGKVNIVFNGGENYAYEIDSAGYIPEEEKMMCTLTVATTTTVGETIEFDGNAMFGIMTLYTADKAIDVGQIELQPKLYVADFTGLSLNYNELSGVPATNTAIGMVKPGDGLEVSSDGTLSISEIEQYAHFFDTVTDMKAATNLKAGDYARTGGFHSLNDGGGALYKITDTGTANEMDVIAVGELYATIVTDSICAPEMFGAYGDKVHDDTASLQTAINLVKDIKLDNEYLVNGSLSLVDGSHLFGNGTLYQPNNMDEKLVNIDSVDGVIIEGLTICNDSGQTGTPANYAGQYLIWIRESSDIVIKNCHFKNAYKRGIEVFKSKDIVYDNNTFVNATFDMLLLFPEVENVQVTNSTFDTITSDLSLAYMFATGGDDQVTVFDFATKNILIDHCRFLNNPRWEGIDTHACVGFTCTNNYIYNCYRGIMAASGGTIKTSLAEYHGDIVIKNNTLVGTVNSTTHGIAVGGNANLYVRNIVVDENNIDNFGGTTVNQASISVTHAKYINVNNNVITNSRASHIYTADVMNGNVCGNECINAGGGYAVSIYSGSWFINFLNNKIKNLGVQKQNAINYQGIVRIEGNDIQGFNSPWYGKNTNMTGLVNQYTTQMGKSGDYVRNGYQLITHYCTDEVVRATKDETMTFTATVSNGSVDVETSAKYTYDLCEGEEIVIAGAGAGGADLTTVITEVVTETHFKIKDAASIGVAGAAISVTESTWVAV